MGIEGNITCFTTWKYKLYFGSVSDIAAPGVGCKAAITFYCRFNEASDVQKNYNRAKEKWITGNGICFGKENREF